MDKGILFQIEKAPKASGDDITCHVLSFEDAVTQLSNFITRRGYKIFVVVLLVDPFFVDCIIFHQYSCAIFIGEFHNIHGIHGCLWWFYVCRFYCVKYSSGCGSHDQPIFKGVFNAFFPIKTTYLLYRFL